MLFEIVSEIPGRLRLRCGRDLMTEAEARGVSHSLMAVPGVLFAEAHAANGSILLRTDPADPAARTAALDAVRSLDVLALPSVEEPGLGLRETELEMALENNRFQMRVVRLLLARAARRALVPAPARVALVCVRAARHILRGLRVLLSGRMAVEVLDAAALAAALSRRSFSEAGTIAFLLRLSSLMEEHVNARARLALRDGLVVRAESVWQVVDGRDVRIATADVREGMVLHLAQGGVLPVDGTVVGGVGELDESSMTGEAALVRKEAGSTVFAGTALRDGDLLVRVAAVPGAARIDRIARMVEESSDLKASAQGRAERLADAIVPYSFLAFLGILAVTRNLRTAMSVLMVDYSCAIKLSTPVAVMSAMNEAARHGIVVRGGRYLEAMAAADTVVFDKTGTLTNAAPAVERVISLGDLGEDEVLRLAACIEEHFPHSMARAIVAEAERRGLSHESELHAEVRYIVAHGIATRVGEKDVLIGSAHFLFEDELVERPAGLDELVERETPAASVIYVACDGALVGAICVSDPPRAEASEVVRELRGRGMDELVMLTGDAEPAARRVASELGLTSYRAQVLPEGKSAHVEALRREGRTVMMVGDGINDSPALAAADVSVAMGDASDVARAVADVLVTEPSLGALVTARDLSERLMARIRRDYRLIVGFNTLLIALGLGGAISLTTAAYLHNASTLAITALNARPLLRE